MLNFASFPSIEGLENTIKLVGKYPYLAPAPILYKSKNKLHGINAGVRIYKKEIVAQTRSQIISSKNDMHGFAKWVENSDYWKSLDFDQEVTIFGEWCGPGIMKSTAINQIPHKIFAVFAVMIGSIGFDDERGFHVEDTNRFIIEPDEIKKILPNLPKDIFVLPWAECSIMVNLKEKESLQPIANYLNAVIDRIEKSDPWVKETFGVEGTAEGLVFYPFDNSLLLEQDKPLEAEFYSNGNLTRKHFSDFAFKVKGLKHKVKATKEPVQLAPEVIAGIENFVSIFVTEARLEQGLDAIGGGLEKTNIGNFLKWMCSDIIKESVAELEESDLEWSDVQNAVQTACKKWFLKKVI